MAHCNQFSAIVTSDKYNEWNKLENSFQDILI